MTEQVSINPETQALYEMFEKGYDAGMEDAYMLIIKAMEEDGERNYISQEAYEYVMSIIKEKQGEQ
jgi:hypothetical protein